MVQLGLSRARNEGSEAPRKDPLAMQNKILHASLLSFFALLAVASASPKKGDEKSETAGNGSSTASTNGINKPTTVGDATWTVLDVQDRGSPMKANNEYTKDANTQGRFIQVHIKVANTGKKEGYVSAPKLVDGTGREFGTMEDSFSFIPKGAESIALDKVQPSLSKEFYELYELPPGVGSLSLQVNDFGLFGSPKKIALGVIPAAVRTTAASATNAPAATAAAPKAPTPKAATPAVTAPATPAATSAPAKKK